MRFVKTLSAISEGGRAASRRRGILAGRVRVRAAAFMLATGIIVAAPAIAHASTWPEGTSGHPFSVTRYGVLLGGSTSDQTLILPYALLDHNIPKSARPQSIQALSAGSVLVADPWAQTVYVMPSSGSASWTYNLAWDFGNLTRPVSATRAANGNTLIVDNRQPRVIEVDSSKTKVWSYGDGVSGTGDGQLKDPWWAVRLANGNTLIADGLGGNRVMEVTTTGTVVWQYGETGVSGTGHDQLKFPTNAERLGNGDTLITDRDGNRVIEVDKARNTVWTFGTGATAGKLIEPTQATRLSTGNTLICDSGNHRVIEVDRDGTIVQTFGTGTGLPSGGTLTEPIMAQRLSDGSTLVADAEASSGKVVRYGYATSGYATSSHIDAGSPTVLKRFLNLSWHGTVPAGGSIEIWYSIAGGTLKLGGTQKSGTSGSFALPSAAGTYMTYKVVLKRGTSYASTPVLKDLSIGWQVVSTSGSTLYYPPAGTNTGTTTGTTVNPSYVGTSSVSTSDTAAYTATATPDTVVQTGAIMAPAGGLIDDPTKTARVGSGASLASQIAGVAALALILTTGFVLGPLSKAVPKIHQMTMLIFK